VWTRCGWHTLLLGTEYLWAIGEWIHRKYIGAHRVVKEILENSEQQYFDVWDIGMMGGYVKEQNNVKGESNDEI
jgi:hypothetical protein